MAEHDVSRTSNEAATAQISIDRLAAVVVGLIVVVVCAVFARRLGDVVGLFLAAVVMAVTTLPMLRSLRKRLGQAAALVVTALTTIAVCLSLAYIALRDLSARMTQVSDLVSERFDELRSDSLIGQVVTATRIDTGAAQWLQDLPSRVVVGGDGGGAVATQIFLFLTVVVLATFLQSSGAQIVDWIVGRWPRRDGDAGPRREAHLLADDIERRGFGFFRRVLTVVAAAALLVGAVGSLVGLPGAVALGIWVGVWAVVPAVGKVVAMVPVVLLVALDQRPVAYIVLATSIVALAIAHVLRRRWIETHLPMTVAPYTMAVALGVAIAGVGGSVVALAIVSVVMSVLTSEHRPGVPEWWRVPTDRTWEIGGMVLPTGWRLVALSAGAAAAGVGIWIAVVGAGRAVIWLLVAGFVAVALGRPVGWLSRRTGMSRRVASDVVCASIALLVIAATLTGADDGARATSTLTERLPSIVADLEDAPVIGGWLADHEASVWVEEQMEDLPQRVRTGRPADWMPFLGDRILDLFWILVLSVALLVDGPRLVRGATDMVPARHRRQTNRLVAAAGVALGGYAAGAALVASINAAVIFAIAVVLGLGVAPALALWGFLWNFVPQIGGFVGGVPLVVFALVLGPLQGLFAGLAFTAYQFLENNLIQPAVVGAAIDIPPWGTLLAAVAGGAAAGVVGAIVLTPMVGVIMVIRRELASDDFPGATATQLAKHDEVAGQVAAT
jgi:predicted PurR-regulated permease PerM